MYHSLKSVIKDKYGQDACNVGDEGGFAPNIQSNLEGIELLMAAIKKAGYEDKVILLFGFAFLLRLVFSIFFVLFACFRLCFFLGFFFPFFPFLPPFFPRRESVLLAVRRRIAYVEGEGGHGGRMEQEQIGLAWPTCD